MLPEVPSDQILLIQQTARKLMAGNRLAEARKACALLLRLNPANVEALTCLAQVCRREKRYDEALTHAATALRLLPGDRDLLLLLSKICRQAGRPGEAESPLVGYLLASPQDDAMLVELARCMIDLGRVAEAQALLDRAVSVAPGNQAAQCLLGVALRRLGDRPAAFRAFSVASELNPQDAVALNGLGNEYLEQERFDLAIDYYRRAVAAAPRLIQAQKNLAFTLSLANRLDEAEAEFRKALELAPGNHEAHMDFGLFLLSVGKYAEGWKEYEHRWQFQKFEEPDWGLGLPRWAGENGPPDHLLLWGEQGIGDHLLYGTMLEDVLKRFGGHVTIAVEKRLIPLFQRSFGGGRVSVIERGTACDATVQCPFGSMGAFVRISDADFGRGIFLSVPEVRRAELRQRYAALGRPGDRLVGLSWRSINWTVGNLKSLDLKALLPVLSRPGHVWVSLQYGEVGAEIDKLAARHGIRVHRDPEIDATHDLEGLAAQVAALDCVVSISNSTVHMAGALGRPCHVLLPVGRGRMWYWPREGERTRWYETIRLVRQREPGDWTAVMDRLNEVLDGDA